MQNAERAVLSRLRAMCEEDFARYDSGNEGLYRRFYDAARTAASVDELLSAVKTKRYAYARLRRMLLLFVGALDWIGLVLGCIVIVVLLATTKPIVGKVDL